MLDPPFPFLLIRRRLAVPVGIALCMAFGPALAVSITGADEEAASPQSVPVLVYHRFAATAEDSMTVRVDNFRTHLRAIEDAGFHVVPLTALLAWQRGAARILPARAVVITVDDDHRSVYHVLWPLLRAIQPTMPITLFIYPSSISNAAYAMTWDDLRTLGRDSAIAIESHTYWHPNFHTERARRDAAGYRAFVLDRLARARIRIQSETGAEATILAWPFGIHDRELEALAAEAGHTAAFTLDARPVTRQDRVMALPRYLITDSCNQSCIRQILIRSETTDH